MSIKVCIHPGKTEPTSFKLHDCIFEDLPSVQTTEDTWEEYIYVEQCSESVTYADISHFQWAIGFLIQVSWLVLQRCAPSNGKK